MTKEETLTYLKAYLNGDTAIGNIIPLRSVLESAIKYLEPSLPSNLDEAANDYTMNARGGYPRVMDETDKHIKAAFIAGYHFVNANKMEVESLYKEQGTTEGAYLKNAMQKVELEKQIAQWWESIHNKINIEHTMYWYLCETARHFLNLAKKTK